MSTKESNLTYIANPDLRYNACEPGKSPCGVVHLALFYDEVHAPVAVDETNMPYGVFETMIRTFREDSWDSEAYPQQPTS